MTEEEFVSTSTMKAIAGYLWAHWCLSVGSAARHSHQRSTDTDTIVSRKIRDRNDTRVRAA
jgi:hypothetical protein